MEKEFDAVASPHRHTPQDRIQVETVCSNGSSTETPLVTNSVINDELYADQDKRMSMGRETYLVDSIDKSIGVRLPKEHPKPETDTVHSGRQSHRSSNSLRSKSSSKSSYSQQHPERMTTEARNMRAHKRQQQTSWNSMQNLHPINHNQRASHWTPQPTKQYARHSAPTPPVDENSRWSKLKGSRSQRSTSPPLAKSQHYNPSINLSASQQSRPPPSIGSRRSHMQSGMSPDPGNNPPVPSVIKTPPGSHDSFYGSGGSGGSGGPPPDHDP